MALTSISYRVKGRTSGTEIGRRITQMLYSDTNKAHILYIDTQWGEMC